MVKARRRPIRSPTLPPPIMNIAITSEYSVMTAWIAVTSVSRSTTSWLMETFITAWSRTITNCAAASTASGTHLRMRRHLPAVARTPRLAARKSRASAVPESSDDRTRDRAVRSTGSADLAPVRVVAALHGPRWTRLEVRTEVVDDALGREHLGDRAAGDGQRGLLVGRRGGDRVGDDHDVVAPGAAGVGGAEHALVGPQPHDHDGVDVQGLELVVEVGPAVLVEGPEHVEVPAEVEPAVGHLLRGRCDLRERLQA